MKDTDVFFRSFEEASMRIGKAFLDNPENVAAMIETAVKTGQSFADAHEKEFQEKQERVRQQLNHVGMRRTHADPV